MSYQLHHKQKFEDLDYRLNNLGYSFLGSY